MTIRNPWFQLGASLVAMIMIANLQYAWTLFVKPMQASHAWSLSDIQWAFTLFILFQTWVQPLDGWLIDRMGPRGFVSAAGALCGLGWAGLGYATSLPMLYALYCLAGVGAAFVYSGSIGLALKWFTERRGLASGIMAAGFGGGTALFIPVIASTIRSSGYEAAFLWTGVLQGSVILLVAQFLRHPPAAAETKGGGAASAFGRHQFTTGEMLRTRQFPLLYLAFVMMATGGLLVTAQAGPLAQTWGLTATALTLAASLSPVANGASRIFWGWASDRIGRETAMVIAFALQAVCLVLVPTVGKLSGWLFTLTLVLTYFTWGEIFSLFPSVTADYFGVRHATSNYAVLYTAKGVASIIAGGVAARWFESLGSWSLPFYLSAALAIGAAMLAYGLRVSTLAKAAPVAAASAR